MRNTRPLETYTVSYSPYREDVVLQSLLHGMDKGTYIDIGAGHPMTASATRFFYDQGWSGINVTPSERIEVALNKYRSRDVVVRAFISDKNCEGVIYTETLGGDLERFSRSYNVPARTLRDILKEHSTNEVDFLKVNTGGKELDVLKGCDWDNTRPKIVCVAVDGNADVRSYMESVRYSEVFSDGKNRYYAESDHFGSNLPMVGQEVYSPYIVSPMVAEEIALLHDKVGALNEKNKQLQLASKEEVVLDADSIRLRQMGKIVVKKVDAHIQGMLMPAITYNDIRPKFDDNVSDYDANVWFSLTKQYGKRNVPSRLHPRRLAMAAYRRVKRGFKRVIKL